MYFEMASPWKHQKYIYREVPSASNMDLISHNDFNLFNP